MSERHDIDIAGSHASPLDETRAPAYRIDGRAEMYPYSVVRFRRHLREAA